MCRQGPEIKAIIPKGIFCLVVLRDGDDTVPNTNASGAMHVRKVISLAYQTFAVYIKVLVSVLEDSQLSVLLYWGHNTRDKSKRWQMHNGFELYCTFRVFIKLPTTELWHRLL